MQTEFDVALRLATDASIDRKLKTVSRSRFFWVYSLSLWDIEAFRDCLTGALLFAAIGLVLIGTNAPLTMKSVGGVVDYFILGLILMWIFYLRNWLQPTNFKVLVKVLFRLYRKEKSLQELSAVEFKDMFIFGERFPSVLVEPFYRIYARIERSTVLGSLIMASLLALFVVGLLLL